jgi:serine/threonine protein kinase
MRGLVAAQRLAEAGFNAPVPMGAGEERRAALLRRSFLLSLAVEGSALPDFLSHCMVLSTAALELRRKREMLRQLARELRRFHDHGFIHGDLVAGNIFVALDDQGSAHFWFMDNDRTRRYPTWLRHGLWRRNLIQLNRLPLAGISLQDRMRFFHAYVNRATLGARERRLLRWLEQKTRQRRRQCDAIDTSGSFRKLMRWEAPAH